MELHAKWKSLQRRHNRMFYAGVWLFVLLTFVWLAVLMVGLYFSVIA